ncbi:MAG: hypothetical protein AAFQ68_04585 [Bacteroidota bacterium]
MKKTILSLLLFLCLGTLSAQSLQFNLRTMPGFAYNGGSGYFNGGFVLETAYQRPISIGDLHFGAEFRAIDWGNQLSLNLGYRGEYWRKDAWRLAGLTQIQVGSALFANGSLFSWGFSYQFQARWQSEGRFYGLLGLGIRFSNAPAYKEFGSINQVWELPVQLGMGLQLGKQGE